MASSLASDSESEPESESESSSSSEPALSSSSSSESPSPPSWALSLEVLSSLLVVACDVSSFCSSSESEASQDSLTTSFFSTGSWTTGVCEKETMRQIKGECKKGEQEKNFQCQDLPKQDTPIEDRSKGTVFFLILTTLNAAIGIVLSPRVS